MRDYAKHEQSMPQMLRSFLTALLALAVAISFSGFSAQLAYADGEVTEENPTYTIIREIVNGEESTQTTVYGYEAANDEGDVTVNKDRFDVPAGYNVASITLVGDPDDPDDDQDLTSDNPIVVPKGSTVLVKIVKDEEQTHKISYTITYKLDGVEQQETTTVTEDVWAGSNELAYDPSKVAAQEGYKLQNVTLGGKQVEKGDQIPADSTLVANYVKDEEQTHKISYTIKYMLDGVEQQETTPVSGDVWVGSDELSYDQSKVEVPDGYKLQNVTLNGNPVTAGAQIPAGSTLIANLVKNEGGDEKELSYTIKYMSDDAELATPTTVTEKVSADVTALAYDPSKVVVPEGYKLQNVTLDGNPVEEGAQIPNGSTLVANLVKDEGSSGDDTPDTPTLEGKWRKDSVGWYYEYPNKDYAKNEWCLIDDEYYHFSGAGYMQTGWIKNGYGIQNNKLESNKWFYLDKEGAMQTGWVKDGGSWYYLLPADDGGIEMAGTMVASTLKSIKDDSVNKTYCFNSLGAMVTGWHKTGDSWLFFGADGAQQYNKWVKSGGSWFWLTPQDDGDGVMAKSAWVDNQDYYVGADGAMLTGWKRIGKTADGTTTVDANGENSWYYFSSTGKVRKSAWIKSEGSWYWMNANGTMAYKTFTPDGKYYLGSNGVMQTGWVKVENAWYHFDASGLKTTSKWIKTGSKWYWLEDTGVMAISTWVNDKYYVDDDGVMVTGWKRIGTNSDHEPTMNHDGLAWYYFGESGAKAVDEWVKKDGKWYWFGGDGAMVEGKWVDGGKYYVNDQGVYDPNAKKPVEDEE